MIQNASISFPYDIVIIQRAHINGSSVTMETVLENTCSVQWKGSHLWLKISSWQMPHNCLATSIKQTDYLHMKGNFYTYASDGKISIYSKGKGKQNTFPLLLLPLVMAQKCRVFAFSVIGWFNWNRTDHWYKSVFQYQKLKGGKIC